MLLRVVPALDSLKLAGDEAIGADIIRKAVEKPLRTIAANGEYEEGHPVRAAERGLHLRSAPHHRMPHHRNSGKGETRSDAGRRHGRHGRMGGMM